MRKRFIRLKELRSNLNKVYTPADDYLSIRKKLQKNEIYTVRTDTEGNQASVWGYNSEKKIYLLGGSSIESIYTKSSMRPHCILEKNILEKLFDCCVYNLGVSGAQTLNIVNLIVNKIGNKKGSIVVVSIPSNDVSVLNLKDNYYSDHWRYASIVPAINKAPAHVQVIDHEPFKKNIKMIIELCSILQLQLYITSIIYTGENKRYEALNKIASEICLSRNIPFINFEPVFKKESDYFYDKLHFLPSGSCYYAECIFNVIKHELMPVNSAVIKVHDICEKNILTKEIIWSKDIKVSNNSIVKVIIDAEFPLDVESKQMLLSIDYGKDDIKSEFRRSENNEIGYFKYISGPVGKRVELITDLKIPNGCTAIRVGLRGWSSQKVKVKKCSVSVVNL